MDKYKRVPRQKEDSKIEENEIRVTTQGKPRNFISYATTQFTEKNATTIQLKAMGGAISKTVTIAEIIKRRIPGLHSLILLESTDIIDYWEPLEEGLDRLETVRHVSSITITLSKNQLDANAPGYQAPLPADQVKEISTPPKKAIGRRSAEGSPQEGSERRIGRGRRPRPRLDGEDFADSSSPSEVPRRPIGGHRGGRGGRGRGRGRGRLPPVGGERGPRPPRQDFDDDGEVGTQNNSRGFPPRGGFSRGGRRPIGRDGAGAPIQGGRGRGRGRRPGGRGRGRGRFPRDEQGAPVRGGQYGGDQESTYED